MFGLSAPFDDGSLALASAAMFGVSRMLMGEGLAWARNLHFLWGQSSLSPPGCLCVQFSIAPLSNGWTVKRTAPTQANCARATIAEPHASHAWRQYAISITTRNAKVM